MAEILYVLCLVLVMIIVIVFAILFVALGGYLIFQLIYLWRNEHGKENY